MSDLVKRLRAYSGRSIHAEAADRIEELEARVSLAESFIPDEDTVWSAYQQALQEQKP